MGIYDDEKHFAKKWPGEIQDLANSRAGVELVDFTAWQFSQQ